MASRKTLNDKVWEDINKRDEKEQRELLKWQLQAREPIRRFSDIKVGDHLIKKKSVGGKKLYDHHFLCIGSEGEGRPTIIHYSNTVANAFRQLFDTLSFGSGSALGQLGIVSELTLPHKDFIQSESELQEEGAEVKRVVWPDELKRYPVDEVVRRATKRKDEKYYHLAKNNCESYVMWCLCDLNISLQSTPLVLSLSEIANGGLRTIFQAFQQIPKIITECIEKKLGCTALGNAIEIKGAGGISCLGSIFGAVSTALIEIGNAAYNIYLAKQKWDEGVLIKSSEQFIQVVIDEVIMALSRCGFTIGGMFIGQCVIPIPFFGSIIGLLAGMLVGHFGGKIISQAASPYLARAVDKLVIHANSETDRPRGLIV